MTGFFTFFRRFGSGRLTYVWRLCGLGCRRRRSGTGQRATRSRRCSRWTTGAGGITYGFRFFKVFRRICRTTGGSSGASWTWRRFCFCRRRRRKCSSLGFTCRAFFRRNGCLTNGGSFVTGLTAAFGTFTRSTCFLRRGAGWSGGRRFVEGWRSRSSYGRRSWRGRCFTCGGTSARATMRFRCTFGRLPNGGCFGRCRFGRTLRRTGRFGFSRFRTPATD